MHILLIFSNPKRTLKLNFGTYLGSKDEFITSCGIDGHAYE